MVKQVSIRLIGGLIATGFLWSNTAFAQVPAKTPVSTSMHLSGSCAKCDLSARIMPGMSLQGANFAGSDFSHSNLAGANFTQANLDNTSFYKAHLMQVKGVGVNLNRSVLRGTTLSDVSLVSSNFTSADLYKADLTGGDFSGSDFTKAKLKSADAIGVTFARVNFTNAKFDHGDFTGSDFSEARFINTKFGDANIENADFSGADFSGAEMAYLTGLKQGQLDVACGSHETQLPEGYSMRICPPEIEMEVNIEVPAIAPPPPVVGMALTTKPMRPKIASRMQKRHSKMIVIRSAEFDEVMSNIDGALGDLPMGSPTRTKLEKVRGQLEVMQAQKREKR